MIHDHGPTKCSQGLCNVMILTTPQSLKELCGPFLDIIQPRLGLVPMNDIFLMHSQCLYNAFGGDPIQSQLPNTLPPPPTSPTHTSNHAF